MRNTHGHLHCRKENKTHPLMIAKGKIAKDMGNTFIDTALVETAPPMQQRIFLLGLGIFLAGILAGCTGTHQNHAVRDRGNDNSESEQLLKDELSRFSGSGYHSAFRYSVDAINEVWFNDADEISVSLLLPHGGEKHPLIIYLPGLGESVNSGILWRNTWAEAGYAVLAIQPASAQHAWESKEARNADFSAVIRKNFSVEALRSRGTALKFVLTGLNQRIDSGLPAYARIDNSKIAVAGYDLGAQTAQLLGGERMQGLDTPALPGLSAILSFSPYIATPYVEASTEVLAGRYSNIQVPWMGVTGSHDTDDEGVVVAGETRKIPFQYMPASKKYLLFLNGGTHRFLSGKPIAESMEISLPVLMPGNNGDRGDGARSGSRHKAESGAQDASKSGDAGQTNFRQRMTQGSQFLQRAELEHQAIAVQAVSTAFLDAFIRNRPQANQWLSSDAMQWLTHQDQLFQNVK